MFVMVETIGPTREDENGEPFANGMMTKVPDADAAMAVVEAGLSHLEYYGEFCAATRIVAMYGNPDEIESALMPEDGEE